MCLEVENGIHKELEVDSLFYTDNTFTYINTIKGCDVEVQTVSVHDSEEFQNLLIAKSELVQKNIELSA